MPFGRGGQSTADVGTRLFDISPSKCQRKRGKIFARSRLFGAKKNTGQVIWKPARKKVHEGLRSQKFSTDRAKNNCLWAVYLPKKKKPGKPFYGLLGLNTDCEPPAGQLFFSRGDVLRTLCYTPQTKRQKFQEEKTKLLYKIQINPNKKIDSVVNLFMVQLSL